MTRSTREVFDGAARSLFICESTRSTAERSFHRQNLRMLLVRKMVFWIFVVIYLSVCPFTILHALGYIVTPGTQHGLVKTGLLSLSTTPPGASVYLEHRRYTQRTPAVIQDLLPGDYHVTLALKRHTSWIHTVHIDTEKATVFDKILLLPATLAHNPVLPDAFEDLLSIPETRLILLTQGGALDDVVVYDGQTGDSRPLLPMGSPLHEGRISWQTAVSGSPFLLARVRLRDGERCIRIDLAHGEAGLVDLTNVLPRKPRWVVWDPREPRNLYAVQDGAVSRVDTDSMALYPKIVEHVRGFGVLGSSLYVLSEELVLQQTDQKGHPIKVLFDDPATARDLFGTTGLFHISVLAKDRILLMGERGELVIRRPSSWLIEQGVRGFEFDRRRQRLLVWRKDRIGVLDMSAVEDDPPLAWVFQEGKDLQQASWVHDGSHVLLRDGHALFLLDMESPDGAALRPLPQLQPRGSIAYFEASGTLYELDRETGRFSSVELLPKHPHPLLPLPARRAHEQPIETPGA